MKPLENLPESAREWFEKLPSNPLEPLWEQLILERVDIQQLHAYIHKIQKESE